MSWKLLKPNGVCGSRPNHVDRQFVVLDEYGTMPEHGVGSPSRTRVFATRRHLCFRRRLRATLFGAENARRHRSRAARGGWNYLGRWRSRRSSGHRHRWHGDNGAGGRGGFRRGRLAGYRSGLHRGSGLPAHRRVPRDPDPSRWSALPAVHAATRPLTYRARTGGGVASFSGAIALRWVSLFLWLAAAAA